VEPISAPLLGADSSAAAMPKASTVATVATVVALISLAVELVPAAVVVLLSTKLLNVAPKEDK
jgi:hypothetical protein